MCQINAIKMNKSVVIEHIHESIHVSTKIFIKLPKVRMLYYACRYLHVDTQQEKSIESNALRRGRLTDPVIH